METRPGSMFFETVNNAYNEYKTFCLEAGHRHPLGRNGFSKRMELLGFDKHKTNNGWNLQKNYFEKNGVRNSTG